jgi:hypothetical protein
MKINTCINLAKRFPISFLLIVSVWTSLSFIGERAFAQQTASAEKKVDYLERVYFSGENKVGLNTQILIAVQELQEKQLDPCLAKQATFLQGIQSTAHDAEDACDILDMLSVGIYNIDAAEAYKQGVKPPSDKAKMKTIGATASLNKLGSASKGINKSAKDLQTSAQTSGGKTNSTIATNAGNVASAAQTVGNIATAAQQTGQQIGDLEKSLGINSKKKDKPCPDVAKKEIAIGDHQANAVSASSNTASSTTVISIQSITSSTLRELTDSLRHKTGVKSAEKSFNELSSTITVVHDGSTDAIADWIEDKFGGQLKLVNYSNGQISLASKTKK